MWYQNKLRGLGITGLFLLVATWVGGCLECKESILGRYDAEQDQFVFLNVYQRIGGQKPADFDYLQTLWNNRDHLITPPIPTILGKTSYLRLSNDEFANLNLGDSRKLEIEQSSLPLAQIQVQPGKFFLRGPDSLCYYDQITVPGAFVDQTLKVLSGKGRENLATEVAKEITRRKDGGKAASWEAARRILLANIQKQGDPASAPAAVEPTADEPENLFNLLGGDSLMILQNMSGDVTANITRQKSLFRMTLPLAEKDAVEIVNLLDAVRTAMAEAMKKSSHDKDLGAQELLLQAVEVKKAEAGLVLSVDAVTLFAHVQKWMNPLVELPALSPDSTGLPFQNAVAAMKAKNIPIDEAITLQQILSDFQVKKLKGFPPEKSVLPGEGFLK